MSNTYRKRERKHKDPYRKKVRKTNLINRVDICNVKFDLHDDTMYNTTTYDKTYDIKETL